MSAPRARADPPVEPRRGFSEGRWRTAIDVRDFIVDNTHGFAGDAEFLTGPSPCTHAVWAKITSLLAEEIRHGVLFFEDLSNEIIADDVVHRLLTVPDVIISRHQAFFTEQAWTAIAEATLASIADADAGRPLANSIGEPRTQRGDP